MTSKQLKYHLNIKLSKFKWTRFSHRKEIAKKVGCSRQSVDNYINGIGGNMEVAEKLIKELSKLKQ